MSPESSCGGLDDSSPSDDKPFLSPICPSGSAPKRNYSELPLLLLIIVKSQSSEITEILSVGWACTCPPALLTGISVCWPKPVTPGIFTEEVQYGKCNHPLLLCTSLSLFIFMQQDSHQGDGPSLSRSTGSLWFWKTAGLIVHKRKADDVESHHHTKIHLVLNGDLWLMTKVFTTPYKATTIQWSLVDHSMHSPYLAIPDCKDRLPPKVDLGILDIEPRQLRESVSFVWFITQFELMQILIRMPHSSCGWS